MSVITLELPLDSLARLHLREGQPVRGRVHDGKLEVTVVDATDSMPTAAQAFIEKWSGKGELLSAEESAADERLAALTAKHLR